MAEIVENSTDLYITTESPWGKNNEIETPPEVVTPEPYRFEDPEEVKVQPLPSDDPPEDTTPVKKEKTEEEKKIAELAYRAKEAEKREKQALLQAEMLRHQNLQGLDQTQVTELFQQAQVKAEYDFNLRHLDENLRKSLDTTEYRSVVDNFNSITSPQPQFQQALLESLFDDDNASVVIKHLVENPAEIHRLYDLSLRNPARMGREIGKMSTSLGTKEETPAPKPKQVSKMPAPVTEVTGATSTPTTAHPDKMSMDDYNKWRTAQRKAKGLYH